MIHVQIDVKLHPDDDDTTAIWSGIWEHPPAVGHTFRYRRPDGTGFYRVTGVDWTVYDEPVGPTTNHLPVVNSAIVFAERYTP